MQLFNRLRPQYYLALAVLATIAVLPVRSQTTATEILGLVKDSSGASVTGAKVTITRVVTGQSLTKVTNEAGEYTFPLIDIGEYTVRVEMEGFRSKTVSGLKVETQQKARVDFILEVGAVTETVEVRATGAV